jgi:site-specific DNA-methyltransferase (adenine-specific)
LAYLDPPFNSNRSYNVLFKDEGGHEAESQIEAFDDTWHWSAGTETVYDELVTVTNGDVGTLIGALRQAIGENQMMAYLVMMAARLVELHRVLKPTGSLYLHCDPTASHYLKILLDSIFGAGNFRAEVIWKRTSAHSSADRHGPVHDTILFYSKSDVYTWNQQYEAYDSQYIETFFEHVDPDGRRWKRSDLTGAGIRHGQTGEPWRGIDVTAKGRHWSVPPSELDKLDAAGRLHWPQKATGMPRLKQYLEDLPGVPLQDVWTDIPPMHNLSAERLGYPTQKPLALLERIITASSNPNDVVLDPFCGCGTTVVAAQKLNRRWIGIDITHLAITLQKYRLAEMFPDAKFEVVGEPNDVQDARQLAHDDRYQFQWWALSLIKARPLGGQSGSKTGKKGSDKGVDGVITFIEDKGKPGQILVQVKSGHVQSGDVRDLVGTVEREQAAMGLFITLEAASRDMETEAATAGIYHSTHWGDFPKVQILTVEDLLHGKGFKVPPQFGTFKQAERSDSEAGKQTGLNI